MGMQWNNETMPFRMSSIAKSGRASYKEDTMRSETGEQCKKLWIGMMRSTIAKKIVKDDMNCTGSSVSFSIRCWLFLLRNHQYLPCFNCQPSKYEKIPIESLNSYLYLLPYVYLHCMQRICFCTLIVFVFALYLNGSAGESWNSRLGSLRLSSQRNPRLSFVTKVRDGKKLTRLLYFLSLIDDQNWKEHIAKENHWLSS